MDVSSSARDITIALLVQRHLRSLRSKYPRAVTFFYAEAQMSWITADRLANVAQQISLDIRIVSRDPKGLGRPGVTTGENEKRLFTDEISEALGSEALVYADDFISDNKVSVQVEFEQQLKLFRRMVKLSTDNNVFSKPKITYSGAGQDDIVMAMGIVLLHSRLTRNSPEYLKEAHEQRFDT